MKIGKQLTNVTLYLVDLYMTDRRDMCLSKFKMLPLIYKAIVLATIKKVYVEGNRTTETKDTAKELIEYLKSA